MQADDLEQLLSGGLAGGQRSDGQLLVSGRLVEANENPHHRTIETSIHLLAAERPAAADAGKHTGRIRTQRAQVHPQGMDEIDDVLLAGSVGLEEPGQSFEPEPDDLDDEDGSRLGHDALAECRHQRRRIEPERVPVVVQDVRERLRCRILPAPGGQLQRRPVDDISVEEEHVWVVEYVGDALHLVAGPALLQFRIEQLSSHLEWLIGQRLDVFDSDQRRAVAVHELLDFRLHLLGMVAPVPVVLSRVRPHVRLGQPEARPRGLGCLAVGFQHAGEQQVVEQHPAGVDDPLRYGPVVVAHFLGPMQQQLGQIDRTPASTDMDGLMVAVIPKAQQRVVAHEGKTDGPIDEGLAQILRQLVENLPEEQSERISRVDFREPPVVGKEWKARLLSEQNGLVRARDGLVYFGVSNLAVEYAEVDRLRGIRRP